MKIRPQERVIKEIVGNHSGFIAITGSRKAESQDRAERLKRKTIEGALKEHDLPNCYMLAPIEDWSSSDVWDYLYMQSQEWVDHNTLGKMYSLAAGDDGDECRTLFEGLEEGSTPGCGKSARYGCWICTLFEKDKTLHNLGKEFEYLKEKEDFRNWLVTFRDDNWMVRDVYNHKYLNEIKYNNQNHRFGMTMPGGMGLEFREEMLEKLLRLEESIFNENGNKFLLTSEELQYIQSCWIEEGDLSFKAASIAKKYGRNFDILDEDIEVAYLAQSLLMDYKSNYKETSLKIDEKLSTYTSKFVNERYFAQLIIHLMKTHPSDYREMLLGLRGYSERFTPLESIKIVLDSPIERKQFYPTPEERESILNEWEKDEVSYWTFLENIKKEYIPEIGEKNLFGYDGTYSRHYEIKDELEKQINENGVFDVIDSEKMSLDEQCQFFDDENKYMREEVFEHRKTATLNNGLHPINPFDNNYAENLKKQKNLIAGAESYENEIDKKISLNADIEKSSPLEEIASKNNIENNEKYIHTNISKNFNSLER